MYLRPPLPRDREPLASLLRRIETFTPDEVDVALELIDESIARPEQSGYQCLVALEPGGAEEQHLGYLCYGLTPMTQSTYDLYWIAVDPDHQGKGVGRRLCQALEESIRQNGGTMIRVETSSQEAYRGTMQFYEDVGYTVGGRLPDFYKPGDDLVIFYKIV